MARQEHVQQKAQQIITQHSQSDLCIIECRDSSFRPANFLFQRIEGQGGRVKQRGRRTTGDIVTEKREAVDQNGETEGNSRGSESIKSAMSALFLRVLISSQEHVRSTELIAALLRNGLNGNSGFGFLRWHFKMNYREIVVECALRVELVMERMLLGVTTDDLNLADFGRSFSAIVRLGHSFDLTITTTRSRL